MTFDEIRVRLVPGEGMALRVPGLAGVAFPAGDAQHEVVRAFLDAVRGAAGEADAGRRAARAVAGLLAQADDAPPLGLVGSDGGGLAVLLNGDVEFAYRDAGGSDQVLSGRDAAAWLDRLLDHVPEQWSLARQGAGAADEWTDLRAGVARADGLATGTAEAAAPAPPPDEGVAPEPEAEPPTELVAEVSAETPPPPVAEPAIPATAPIPAEDFESISLSEPVEDEAPRGPLPVISADTPDPPPPPEEANEPAAPQVQGVMCARGHFNDPNSPFCATCGISMVQQTHNLVSGPRPPLGVLVLDDGSTYVVDRDVVIGREPEGGGDTVRTITLPDPERAISRVHAKVTLHEWEPRIADAGSANGTFVAARNATEWTPVPAEAPVPLTPGMHVLVGQRVLSYDTHRRG